ncbi:hypothetical protein CCR94_16350 [Rhodoblastus sphagnicola]|uniref:Uncharacterized protein n=1 Tax=Rhodoblastus sphagnicola TaxID=333368 RepID=A0A2S6N2W4_9HYPH|nr:hypothetical protein [Rhodoblastus sphagnicola]MBB4199066.1 hypothetical protein [Rhodoblastus sphagnicola]PPQ28961.1 hypothetical protein CCR94_16350 [Rhodoblastus sphagnicola]
MAESPYLQILAALARCSFLPGRWDKRFVNSMLQKPFEKWTKRQKETVLRLVNKYRRQINTGVIMLAQDAAWELAVEEMSAA